VRVLTVLTPPDSNGYQGVSFAELYPAFIKRMRSRYCRDIDVGTVDLKTSDKSTFDIWGSADLSKHGLTFDPEDRAIQTNFWKRYIGQSKSRLTQVFNKHLVPVGVRISDGPYADCEHEIDVQTLRTLSTTCLMTRR
jgi:hypothetical protein